jgi:hypothetical protein
VTAAAADQMATEQLGGWRLGARGELRALARLLRPGEQVLGVALGTIGNWRGRLFVATESRVLVVHKPALRGARFTEIPYEAIELLHAAPKAGVWRLSLHAFGHPQAWNLQTVERAKRFLGIVAERSAAEQSTIESAVDTTCASTPRTALSLPLDLAALTVIVLFISSVLPREPALVAFLMLAAVLAVLEWRTGTPTLQIALSVVTTVAVAGFVFELLPFGAGALLAGAAIATGTGFRRRAERATASR